jgi:serine/threonine protein phosphatase PrpC
MANLNIHRGVYPLTFVGLIQSVGRLSCHIITTVNNISEALLALIRRVIESVRQFYQPLLQAPLEHRQGQFLVTQKGRVLVPPNCSKWKPRHLSLEKTMTKMFKNMHKAIKEHLLKAKREEFETYAPYSQALPTMEALRNIQRAEQAIYTSSKAHDIGGRKKMEDDSFFLDSPASFLAGVFDGHGGKKVAEFACREFKLKFADAVEKAQGIVHRAFENVFEAIQQSIIAKDHHWKGKGTTAVVSYIDKATNVIYTATLGDSEAKIYRPIDGDLKSIPLSVVRDWGSEKDASRAAIHADNPDLYDAFVEKEDSKDNRVNRLNVSRALGDVSRSGTKEKPLVIHKPKITVNILKPGDTVIWACDGLWEEVLEKEIVDCLNHGILDPAKALVNYRLKEKKGYDNISVIALQTR